MRISDWSSDVCSSDLKGFQQFLEILDGGRISVAAMGLGLAQGAYDLAAEYARERKQFGKPIASFQAIQFQLADLATEIEAGRNMVRSEESRVGKECDSTCKAWWSTHH